MKLIKQTTLYYREGSSDKVYQVDLCELGANRYLVNFRYGKRGSNLKEGSKTVGAVPLTQAQRVFDELVDSKVKKGYQHSLPNTPTPTPTTTKTTPTLAPSGDKHKEAILRRLQNFRQKSKWPLERVIWRAGELKISEAAPLLISLIGTGKDLLRDYCIAWALGWCGSDEAIEPLSRLYQQSPHEAVRRIAGEALLKLSDEEMRISFSTDMISKLPPSLRESAKNGPATLFSKQLPEFLATIPKPKPAAKPAAKPATSASSTVTPTDSRPFVLRLQDILARLPQSLPELQQLMRSSITQNIRDYLHNYLKSRAIPQEAQALINNAISPTPVTSLNQASPSDKDYDLLSVIETLYLINNEHVRPALLRLLRTAPLRPSYFQRLRHIFKMAEYRRDGEVFGLLAYRFEKEAAMFQAPKYGNYIYLQEPNVPYQVLKSDIKKPDSPVAYGEKTRNYLRKRVWRTLRRLGELNQSDYIKMAVGVLLPFSDADAGETRLRQVSEWRGNSRRTTKIYYDLYAPYIAFNYILYTNSPRYTFKSGSRAWRCQGSYKPGDPLPKEREEAFPKLWEQMPAGLLHLLSESNAAPVHSFAIKALRNCPDFCRDLDANVLIMLLERPYEVTAELGFELAQKLYNPTQPVDELVLAVVNSILTSARQQGYLWIEANRTHFLANGDFIIGLVTSAQADTRAFARNLLRSSSFTDSTARTLIGRLIAYLMALGSIDTNDPKVAIEAQDIAETIFKSFGPHLRSLGLNIVMDILSHKLLAVQELGGQILLNHNIPASDLPESIIHSLINSNFESMRGIGLKLLSQWTNEKLVNQASLLIKLETHSLADIRQAIAKIVAQLAQVNAHFASQSASQLLAILQTSNLPEEINNDIVHLLEQSLLSALTLSRQDAWQLTQTKSSATRHLGGLVLQIHSQWASEFTTLELIKLSNNEIKTVREAAKKLFCTNIEHFRNSELELATAVRLLDGKWEDTRLDWFTIFQNSFDSTHFTPAILISICDSTREDVQKFGRDLVLKYFQEDSGQEYLLKLSEHPSQNLQLFASNYLESYVANNPARLRELKPYFISVLSRVNKARIAKERIFAFLWQEATTSEAAAQVVAEILTRHSVTMAIGDKAKSIETMLKIQQTYPQISLPIQIKPVEVSRGV